MNVNLTCPAKGAIEFSLRGAPGLTPILPNPNCIHASLFLLLILAFVFSDTCTCQAVGPVTTSTASPMLVKAGESQTAQTSSAYETDSTSFSTNSPTPGLTPTSPTVSFGIFAYLQRGEHGIVKTIQNVRADWATCIVTMVGAIFVLNQIYQQQHITRSELIIKLNDYASRHDLTVICLEKLREMEMRMWQGEHSDKIATIISDGGEKSNLSKRKLPEILINLINKRGEKQGIAADEKLIEITKSIVEWSDEKTEERTRATEFSDVVADSNLGTLLSRLLENDYKEARGYLRFCESVMLMLENRVVSGGEIFSLLAYRMLLVTNSRRLQVRFLIKATKDKQKPVRHNSAFCSIYALNHRLHKFIDDIYGKEAPSKLMDLGFDQCADLRLFSFYDEAVREFYARSRNGRSILQKSMARIKLFSLGQELERSKRTNPLLATVVCPNIET